LNLIVSEGDLCDLVFNGFELSANDAPTIEDLGCTLSLRTYPVSLHANPPQFWKNLKEEFRLLVCTNDKKYKSLRKQLGSNAGRSQTVIVSTISAAMAHSIGVTAGVLVPFCALCLLALARLGKEAFCDCADLKVPVRPQT
jgi:hypothetical protein